MSVKSMKILNASSRSCDPGRRSDPLLTPSGISYRRKALAKLSLLTLGFLLLIRLAHLLLGTRPLTCTTRQKNDRR
jgi:hypothetical protein